MSVASASVATAVSGGVMHVDAATLPCTASCDLTPLARNWTSASDATNAKPSRSMNSTGAAVLIGAPCEGQLAKVTSESDAARWRD